MTTDLFDFQINGFAGVDFQRDDWDEAALLAAFVALRKEGLGNCFVTLITDEIDRLCVRFERFETVRADNPLLKAMIAGYHLEGPWLSPESGYIGAHRRDLARAPKARDFALLQSAANGRIRLVTLAPEWPGSRDFIALLSGQGVNVSLGHTNADERQIDDAITAGARFCTHLGNGVPLMLPRHDNIIQRLLARDELTACLIPDGRHIPPFVLRTYVRAKGWGRVLFTTDAMAGAGAPPGRYTLGSLAVEVGPDRIAAQPGGGGFAGSTLTPLQGVKHVVDFLGLPPGEAKRLWSIAPRQAFGMEPSTVVIT